MGNTERAKPPKSKLELIADADYKRGLEAFKNGQQTAADVSWNHAHETMERQGSQGRVKEK